MIECRPSGPRAACARSQWERAATPAQRECGRGPMATSRMNASPRGSRSRSCGKRSSKEEGWAIQRRSVLVSCASTQGTLRMRSRSDRQHSISQSWVLVMSGSSHQRAWHRSATRSAVSRPTQGVCPSCGQGESHFMNPVSSSSSLRVSTPADCLSGHPTMSPISQPIPISSSWLSARTTGTVGGRHTPSSRRSQTSLLFFATGRRSSSAALFRRNTCRPPRRPSASSARSTAEPRSPSC